MNSIHLAQDGILWRTRMKKVMKFQLLKRLGIFLAR